MLFLHTANRWPTKMTRAALLWCFTLFVLTNGRYNVSTYSIWYSDHLALSVSFLLLINNLHYPILCVFQRPQSPANVVAAPQAPTAIIPARTNRSQLLNLSRTRHRPWQDTCQHLTPNSNSCPLLMANNNLWLHLKANNNSCLHHQNSNKWTSHRRRINNNRTAVSQDLPASTRALPHLLLHPVSSFLLHPHPQRPVARQVLLAPILAQCPHPCLTWEWQDAVTRQSCQCAQTPANPRIRPELLTHHTQVRSYRDDYRSLNEHRWSPVKSLPWRGFTFGLISNDASLSTRSHVLFLSTSMFTFCRELKI